VCAKSDVPTKYSVQNLVYKKKNHIQVHTGTRLLSPYLLDHKIQL